MAYSASVRYERTSRVICCVELLLGWGAAHADKDNKRYYLCLDGCSSLGSASKNNTRRSCDNTQPRFAVPLSGCFVYCTGRPRRYSTRDFSNVPYLWPSYSHYCCLQSKRC